VEGFGPQNLFSPQDDPNREIDDIVGDAKSIDKEGSRRPHRPKIFAMERSIVVTLKL